MSIIPIINDDISIIGNNKININTNTDFIYKNVGPMGPTGPKGTDMVPGDTTVSISTSEKIIETITAETVTFDNDTSYKDYNLLNFIIKIQPIQNLHGYDYPWKPGYGKNHYNKDAYPFTEHQAIDLNTGEIFYNDSTAATDFIPLSEINLFVNNMISLNYPPTDDNLIGMAFYDNNYQFIGRSKGWGKVIPENSVYIRIATDNEYSDGENIQLELGNSPSSYEPYSNICPISGSISTVLYTIGTDVETQKTYNLSSIAGVVYYGELDLKNGIIKKYSYYSSYDGEILDGEWISSLDKYEEGTTPSTGAQVVALSGESYIIYDITTEFPSLIENQQTEFYSPNNLLQITYEENQSPHGSVSISTNKEGVSDFDFNFTFPNIKGDLGPTGATGAPGIDGNGIVEIRKTSTSGAVDIYTIYFTNGEIFNYTVTNGVVYYYNGPYEVTPMPYSSQILPTNNLAMSQDVNVREIPYYEVENLSGGITATIGDVI